MDFTLKSMNFTPKTMNFTPKTMDVRGVVEVLVEGVGTCSGEYVCKIRKKLLGFQGQLKCHKNDFEPRKNQISGRFKFKSSRFSS